MLTSITPLGERGRGNSWAVTVAAYLVGSVLGGALTGAVLGLLGATVVTGLPGRVVVALAAKIARVAWVIMNRPGALYERRDPAFA